MKSSHENGLGYVASCCRLADSRNPDKGSNKTVKSTQYIVPININP